MRPLLLLSLAPLAGSQELYPSLSPAFTCPPQVGALPLSLSMRARARACLSLSLALSVLCLLTVSLSPQGALPPASLPLLSQPQHDAVERCAALCLSASHCVSFDAGTVDGSVQCYRAAGGTVSTEGRGYQYFSMAHNSSDCVPHPRGCAREASSLPPLSATATVRRGCTQPGAYGYSPLYNVDDGSCQPAVAGCMDPRALNRDLAANSREDSACVLPSLDQFTCPLLDHFMQGYNIIRTDVPGEVNHWSGLTVEECASLCLSFSACLSFDFTDGSAVGGLSMCYLGTATSATPDAVLSAATGYNYYERATTGPERCARGCTQPDASNYSPSATQVSLPLSPSPCLYVPLTLTLSLSHSLTLSLSHSLSLSGRTMAPARR